MIRCLKGGRKGLLGLIEGIQSVVTGETRWQTHGAVGHIMSVVQKQKDKHWCSAHFSSLFILGPQPMDGPAHIRMGLAPQLNLSGTCSDTPRWVIPE